MKSPLYKNIKCPIHKLDMYYHHPSKQYACQDIDCKYAHGVKEEDIDTDTMGDRE